MSDLFWPGDHRAGDHLTAQAYVDAMVRVESAWVGHDLPAVPAGDLAAASVESGGNPVIALVALLRERSGDEAVHRGLTSQDVVDSALMLLLRDAVDALLRLVRHQVTTLAELARAHRDTPMVARTLTQHAVPTTFGAKVASWLDGVLDAYDDLGALSFPVQLGGAGGTLAALVELGRDPEAARAALARDLGLAPAPPWHTRRRPVTRVGDALTACTDAWGRLANDVLTLSRPEIGELSEGAGGGSSTMPHKANPVLAVLVRRAALGAPQLAATLHLAAADQADERASGAWHLEWDTLRLLTRRTLVAADQTAALVRDLRVRPERMAATLAAAGEGVLAEQRSMAAHAGHDPAPTYVGVAPALVDAAVVRAEEALR